MGPDTTIYVDSSLISYRCDTTGSLVGIGFRLTKKDLIVRLKLCYIEHMQFQVPHG